AEGEGELVVLVAANNAEALQEIALLAAEPGFSQDAAATIAVEGFATPFDPLYGLGIGRRVGILLAPRAGHGQVIFRPIRLKQCGPLRSVHEPIWDWLIRAVRGGEKIKSSPVDLWPRSSGSRLPLLVPARPGNNAAWLLEHLNAFSPNDF